VLDSMSPYFAVISARFRMLLEYRAAALAGFATQLFWGAVKLMIFAAFYRNSSAAQPMSWRDVVIYVWLGQALLGLLPWNLDPELQEKMTSGAVAYELLRPLDLYGFWYARTLAFRCASTALRMPLMLLSTFFVLPAFGWNDWSLAPPPSAMSGFLFLSSLGVTVALSAAITMLMNAAMVMTISARGLNTVMVGLVLLFSGMVAPLPLFPDWLQPLLHWQPFRGLVDVPFRIYSGNIPPAAASLEIALQLAWTAALVAAGRLCLGRASAKLVVQGG
jgi:ABC-2 type transport system permease protein